MHSMNYIPYDTTPEHPSVSMVQYSHCALPGAKRQARNGKLWSLAAAGLMNIRNVTVPMSTHSMLVM